MKCIFHHLYRVFIEANETNFFFEGEIPALKWVFSFSAPQLVNSGDINYLVFDYLSEITMSLLARAKQKNPVSKQYHKN